jgi:hypothetical protein
MGILFIYKGKIRSVVFDKNYGTLTVKKRNLFCDKRSIVTYSLKDITDVKAVYRGFKSGSVNTMMYSIIIEFECNRWEDDPDTDEAESYHSTSEEDY